MQFVEKRVVSEIQIETISYNFAGRFLIWKEILAALNNDSISKYIYRGRENESKKSRGIIINFISDFCLIA